MEDFMEKVQRHFTLHFLGDGAGGLGKVLASETSLNILEALSQKGDGIGVTAAELSEVLGIARTTVIYHLGRLQETGLVALNPALSDWGTFWEDYRKGRSLVSKEDFNRVHGAKMKGEKLYLPTGRGVLFVPTDPTSGEAVLRDAFSAITAPSVEGIRDTMKTAAATGILGIFLLAISFILTPGMVTLPGAAGPMAASDYSPSLASAPTAEPAQALETEPSPRAMVEDVPAEAGMEMLTVVGCGGGGVPPATEGSRSVDKDMTAEEGVSEDGDALPGETPPETRNPPVYDGSLGETRQGSLVLSALKYVGVLFIGVALAMGFTVYRNGRVGKTI